LKVGYAGARHALADAVIAAFEANGTGFVADYCAGSQEGVYDVLTTAAGGRRQSTARAYLAQARKRPNLRIVTGALVEKVVLEGRRATGLRLLCDDGVVTVRARETILSAGAIGSPAILLRSGIGPAEHLQRLDIEVIADRPVGKNLQEHCGFAFSKFVDVPTYNSPYGAHTIARDLLRWCIAKTGPMASAAVQVMAGVKSSPDMKEPDIAMSFMPLAIEFAGGKPRMAKRPGISLGGLCMRPKSRGEIRLRSPDPYEKPIVDHRLLGHEDDLQLLAQAAQMLSKVWRTAPLADHVVSDNMPQPEPLTLEGWKSYLRERATPGYHPAGTCAMGGEDAVLDPRLRVRRLEGLRVVDASVMPRIISGNTNAATIAIAEKSADMIKQDLAFL
jgi:choline dehydrogenase